MKNESMIETAFGVLTKKGDAMKFGELWGEVKTSLEIGPDEEASRIGHFYTDLSLDGRFVALSDNVWDLRSRLVYDKVHIDIADVYTEVNQSDEDAADKEENREYDEYVEGGISHSEESAASDEEIEPKKEDGAELLGLRKSESNEY